MALEAVNVPENSFSYLVNKDIYSMLGGFDSSPWSYDGTIGLDHQDHDDNQSVGDPFAFLGNQTVTFPYYGDNSFGCSWSSSPSSMVPRFDELHLSGISSQEGAISGSFTSSPGEFQPLDVAVEIAHPKRRRPRSRKNKVDVENQRMTHIAVERNRRKQMNEYLAALRTLMPESCVQRGDQASIIGGAINFVKELEQQVQCLSFQKEIRDKKNSDDGIPLSGSATPFFEFFTFPQFSTSGSGPGAVECQPGVADVEVTMVESYANLKIRSKRWPKQLLKVVSGLHSMRLTVHHLNVTTKEEIVLYCLSLKVEDDCKLTSVEEIATGVYQILVRNREDALMLN